MQTRFPTILLDDGRPGNMYTPDDPALGRIWNIFSFDDLDSLAHGSLLQPPILRIYDLSLIEKLSSAGFEKSPLILSHLIDLSDQQLPGWSAGLAIEVANRAGLAQANTLSCDLVIGRSFEVAGPSRECSSFVLFQLLSSESRHPFYLHGNTGYDLFQAYLALGVSGIVLPEDQFNQDKGAETFRFPLVGDASLRLRVKGGAPEAVALRERLQTAGLNLLAETFADGMWDSQLDDLLSSENRPRINEYIKLAELSPRSPAGDAYFYPDNAAARQLHCSLPIVQGAMANISRSPAFAKAVFEAGAFPVMALAGLSVEHTCTLLRETAALGIPFGAGIVSVSEDTAALELIIECLEETSPALVVLAAPQLDHVQRLLRTELNLAVHAPNGAMFRVLYDMGVRTFIIEGEEAGGHVSRIGSLSAWQEVLHEVRERGAQHEVHLILAGGIKSESSARLISQLIIFSGMARELKVSLQMGTAYLSTYEALELTAMPEVYQQLLFSVNETIVTGETLHRNVRQLATPATVKLLQQEWSIFTSDLELVEKKQAYGQLYTGAHQRAVSSQGQDPSASYLAGSVATLIDRPVSLLELHQALIETPCPEADASDDAIAIVGVGVQIPGADSIEEHFRNLLLKRCFIRDVPDERLKRSDFLTTDPNDRSRSYSGLAGMVENQDEDLSMFRIPPRVSSEMASFQVTALHCANRALQDSGFFHRPVPRNRVATLVGVNGNSSQLPTQNLILWATIRERLLALSGADDENTEALEALFEQYQSRYNDDFIYTEDTRTGQLASIVASRIANVFDLGGMTNTLDAACASGLAAMSQAAAMLSEGRCDIALAGSIAPALKPDTFVSFSSLQALSAQGLFPFDYRGDGFVVGEGGGMFVLKRERDALLHGDRIYALIRGWGSSSDGAGKGITAPSHKGQQRAMEDAYSRTDIDPLELDFLECHATGTPVGDHEERISIHDFFGAPRQKLGKPLLPIGGSKAVTGHLLSGAGVVSTLSALLAINLHRVPPQVNFERPPADIDLESMGLKVVTRPEVIDTKEVRAAVSSFGFGGVNYHMVFSSPRRNSYQPLVDPAIAEFPRFDRLTGDTLFLFPGQGSQYPGMLHALRDDATVRSMLARALGIFSEYSEVALDELLFVDPSLDESVLKPLSEALNVTEVSQPAIFLSSVILFEKLREKGLQADMAIGHSLGEYSALYAAGMLSFDDAFRMVCIRGKLMSSKAGADPGAMAALACSDRQAWELIDGLDGYATCANINSYQQTVVSGETAVIEQLMEQADASGIRAYRLPVARAFHSRLVGDCETPMVSALSECDWRNAAIPVLANISRQAYPLTDASLHGQPMSAQDRDITLSLLARQIASTVDFIAEINAAYESGIRRFVEVGPKNILTRLVDQILQGKPFQTEALDHPAESMTSRIDGLSEQLQQPLLIKRQPLPAQRTVIKAEARPDLVNTVASDPAEQVRAAVAEISGYARDQIRDDAEFERDLGIDTLKIFEILSRLRGSVLPQQVENFRELTSIEKILAVAASSSENDATGATPGQEADTATIECYHYRTSKIGRLGEASGSVDEQRMLIIEQLPATASATAEELLPRLHRLLRDHGNMPVEKRPAIISMVSYGAESEFYDGAYQALTAFFRCAQKDIPETTFTYTHIDGAEPSSELIGKTLRENRVGRRILPDGSILQGRLCRIERFFGNSDRLEDLLTEKDVVLVTGGARGITGEVAKSLIEKTRARFLILARQPQLEPWIEAFGEERVRYFAVDMLDEKAIAALDLGRYGITLLIHGAGIEISQNLVNKSDEEFARVLAVKVGGLERLLAQLDPGTLRGVIQFSSVVSYVGNNGQADYGAANGILNGTLPHGIPSLSIAWSAWDEVGMATRGVIKQIFETRGVKMIPLKAGIEVFQEMLSGFLTSPPDGALGVAVFGTTGAYQSLDDILQPAPEPISLSQYRLSDPEGLLEFEINVDLDKHSFLIDHSIDGNVVTPASVMLRQFVATSLRGAVTTPDTVIQFKETEFLLPLILRKGEKTRLRLTRQGDEFIIDKHDEDRTLPVMRTRMQLLNEDDESVAEAARIASELESLGALKSTPFDISATPVTAEFGLCNFGPAFDVLNSASYNGFVICGRVDLEKAAAEASLFTDTGRVAYLIESAIFGGARWHKYNVMDDRVRLPSSIGSCTLFPQRCAEAGSATVYAKCYYLGTKLVFDCVVVDENSRPLIVLSDCNNSPGSIAQLVRRPLARSVPVRLGASQLLLLELPDAIAWGEANSFMDSREISEINALNSPKRKHEKLAGKLAAKLLARNAEHGWAAAEAAELIRYQVLSDNAPVRLTVDGKAPAERPFFSISHTDDLVCAASADVPVGVDLERVRELPEKTVQDICGEELMLKMRDCLEQDWLKSSEREVLGRALPVLIFTQKEAVLKAAGIGLAEGLDEVRLEEVAVNREVLATHRGISYRVISSFNAEYVVSVALASEDRSAVNKAATPVSSVALSYLQESLCKTEYARTDGRNYSLTHRIHMSGTLDVASLKRALDVLHRQHDVLRMGFHSDCTGFIRAPAGVQLLETRLDELAQDEAELQAEHLLDELAERRYDLTADSLYRPMLIHLPGNVYLLLINFHHLIMDCFSSFDYSSALLRSYRLIQQGADLKSDTEIPQYDSFTARQRERLTADRLAKLQRYWTDKLAGRRPVEFPVHAAPKPGVTHTDFRIGDEEVVQIEAYCRRVGVTTFIGLLTAIQAALLIWLQRKDMIVGVPFSLKDRTAEQGIFGPFVNLLPIRGAVSELTTWEELSQELRAALFDAIDHHDIPSDILANTCQQASNTTNPPGRIICQLIFEPEGEDDLPDLAVRRDVVDGYDSEQALVFSFFREANGMRCAVTRNTSLVDGEALDTLITSFRGLLATMCAAPDDQVFRQHS